MRRLRESLGISADGSEKAFSSADLEAMMKRIPERINYNPRNPAEQTNHIIVAVDPSGGGASAFSIATLTQDHRGFYHVRSRLLHSKPPFLVLIHLGHTQTRPLSTFRRRA